MGFSTIVLALAAAATVSAQDREHAARELEAMLIAPCCFTQQVSVHHSPAADEVRQDIRKRLEAGQTRDQILQAYVGQYGTRILAEPPVAGAGKLLYALSALGFAIAGAILVVVLRRVTRRRAKAGEPTTGAAGAADERYAERLDDQLRDLD